MFLRISNIHRKTPVLESNFCIIKKKLQQRHFPANIAKFLRTALFVEHLYLKLLFDSIYPFLTPSAPLCIAVSSAQDVLLGIVSIYIRSLAAHLYVVEDSG